jgi:NAD(P)-dependent dehydrogenase (short-subunit alcohol dehydrogenase family)
MSDHFEQPRESKSLQGKVAVVTGGSAGLGFATAKRFVELGASVFITGRRQKELDQAALEIGGDVVGVRADSSQLADIERLYDAVKTRKGKLDIVFANAAILELAPIGQITEAMIDRLFSVNLKGVIFTVQNALPLLIDGGAVILTSSTVANKGYGGYSVYGATKAAIRHLARSWIVDLKARKIRVNVVSPGPTDTPGFRRGSPDEATARARIDFIAAHIPAGRIGEPDDIADVVAFLASDRAAFINGADIAVDGGWAQI